jgi:hypothetical protein
MAVGLITLGEMRAKGMTMLEVACRRCERRCRLRIERLIAEYGLWCLTYAPSSPRAVRVCAIRMRRFMTAAGDTAQGRHRSRAAPLPTF